MSGTVIAAISACCTERLAPYSICYAAAVTDLAYLHVSATRCPVLTMRTSLAVCYAMSGTNPARVRYYTGLVINVRPDPVFAVAPPPTALRPCYAMSGTHIAYGPTRLRTPPLSNIALLSSE
eukprot:162152-Rhodomonas_salina.2